MATLTTFHNPIHTPWQWGDPFAAPSTVPWEYPCAINSHPYVMDFEKSRITTMPVRRQSADDSVEPGEQTLSVAGVWPRAQDNFFLGVGQLDLDNRFAFESVYVHSGEYPSVRTRGWKSQGVDPWSEGRLSLHNAYGSAGRRSTTNMLLCVCGDYLYATDGQNLWWTYDPTASSGSLTWTQVTTTNTAVISSMVSDGTRVWIACGAQGVFVTVGGTTTVAAAAQPAALNGVGGLIASVIAAGTLGANLAANESHTWAVTEVDAFGNETAPVYVTVAVTTTPVALTWNPDQNASSFNVYRDGLFVSNTSSPTYTDDGTDASGTATPPLTNGTGQASYPATFLLYAKGHLIGSTGPDLVEILATGSISFIAQQENPAFVYTCGCECPSAILVGGYAGHQSFIGAIQPDTANDGATLAPPTWASTLAPGEQINAIAYSAGAMLLGTSLGIRGGTKPDSTGVFDVNPVIEDPGSVLCVAPWAQYEYFGWSNYNPAESWAPTRQVVGGLGRADLSQYTTPGVPAYASDVMGVEPGMCTQVVVMEGVPYFVLLNSARYTLYGPTGSKVTTGWWEPGWIRYGTLERKIVVEVDFQHDPLPAGCSINYSLVAEDTVSLTSVGTNAATGSTTLATPLSAGLQVGDRFMPIITLNGNGASTPTLRSHIAKAMVVTKRQDEIMLALIWDQQVGGPGAPSRRTAQRVLDEYFYLKGMEGTGVPVNVTIGAYRRWAYIDQVLLEPRDQSARKRWLQGAVTVKMISLDDGVILPSNEPEGAE